MGLSLYDTATGAIRPFEPLRPNEASIYCCGLTVQAAPHLGHIRKEVVFDVLRRWMTYTGTKVTLVVNITDLNEKIVTKGEEAGRPWWEHAYLYERELHKATAALGVLPPTYEPRATGHITEQIELVEAILANGHAYVADDGSGDVYFDVLSWPSYGELTHQSIADMEPDEDANQRGKRDPRDFALWKGYKQGEPYTMSWPSPWGRGRPGWHLECSAMAGKYLGDAFDIHGGGIDLRFPHHENELAQSRSAGRPFAQYWMHNGFVTDPSGEKMSKSLGNGMVVTEVVQRWAPRVVRYYLVAPHYRSMVEFSELAMNEAEASLARIDSFVKRATERVGAWAPKHLVPVGLNLVVTGFEDDCALPDGFVAAMDDDLGTPAAVAILHETVREGNRALDVGDEDGVRKALAQVQTMLAILGLWADDPIWAGTTGPDELEPVVDGLVKALLEQRGAARARKDYATSDAIRDSLGALGLTIEDTPQGPRWSL
ncbi:MAG: cysteine--tRNA ligase [Propionibacteriaceae bacterium]|jgi:cysteinyl-tRNA synthetase|nr:cysteine--tRNA ligase [Propionibacteriaceae bacterium]